MTSIETKNVRFSTFVSSIKFSKLVVSLRFDFCDFDSLRSMAVLVGRAK